MDNKIIPIIIGFMAVLVIALGVLIFVVMGSSGGSGGSTITEAPAWESEEFAASPVDSGARIEIEVLRSQLEALGQQIEELEKQIRRVADRPPPPPQGGQRATGEDEGFIPRDGPNQIIDAYAQVVLIANRRKVNEGLKIAGPSYLEGVFGKPRAALTSKCESMTNARLKSKLFTERVGPIRVTMLRPALDSLGRVFDKIKQTDPDLYDRINTAGALCVRHIRGAPGRTSTHAFGLSVDLNIDGRLDRLGDGKTQLGLTIMADFFKTEGWYWGAGFSREDSMHFEVSRTLVEKWIAAGQL